MKKYGKRMQFDPMTGEPIDPDAKFDPMTGEPIDPDAKFDPMTGEPLTGRYTRPQRNRKKMVIVGTAAAVAVIGLTVFGVVKSGIFFSDTTKVMIAAANTAKDIGHFKETAKAAEIFRSGEYTAMLHAEAEGVLAEAKIAAGETKVQIAANVDLPESETVSALAEMNKNEVRAEVPAISDKMFAYNYNGEKGGYLAEEEDLEEIDDILQSVREAFVKEKDMGSMWKELVGALSEEWKETEFTKTSPEEYEVDGKFRKCKGYTASLSERDLEDLLSVTEDVIMDHYDRGYGEKLLSNLFASAEYALEDLSDLDLTCYIYKRKLAAIQLEIDGNELEIHFLGGDTRIQNMEVIAEDETVVEIEGQTDGTTEFASLYIEGEEVLETEYDTKSGKYEIGLTQDDIALSGVFLADKKKIELSAESIEVYGDSVGADFQLSIQKGVEFQKFEGEVFDVGEASESELEDLAEEVLDQIEDNEDLEDFVYELEYYL